MYLLLSSFPIEKEGIDFMSDIFENILFLLNTTNFQLSRYESNNT